MKKVINITIWVTLSAAILVVLGFAVTDKKKSICKEVRITLANNKNPGFIGEKEIYQLILKHHDSLVGMYLDSINTRQIRETLLKNPYIKNAEITKTLLGTLRVKVERFEPMVRIVNEAEEYFYISREGVILPASKFYFPRLLTATGFIKTSQSKAHEAAIDLPVQQLGKPGELASIRHLALKLEQHPNLKNHIQQIYFNQNGDIELVPSTGGYVIILGDVYDLELKLRNLLALYHTGYQNDSQKFRSINLKYTNQVVCKK